MIVGIEPFGHFQRRLRRIAPRQLEIFGQGQRLRDKTETRGQATEQCCGIEHLVVPGKIADGHEIQPALVLPAPGFAAQCLPDDFQFGLINFATPETFQREFQFALAADARESQYMSNRHDFLSFS